MAWKKLSTKKILDHPRIKVYEDTVALPNGHLTDYVYWRGNDAATVIAINSEGKILLQKEYSYPMNERLFQFPGGAIENGETPMEGAVRELAEEAQLAGSLSPIGWLYINNRRSAQKLHVFTATNLRTVASEKDPEEEFEDFWFTSEEIANLIGKNEIHNYSALSAWALFQNSDLQS